MVKNLNTIERSERIRIGKYTPDEQAINSIIVNASSEILEANTSGFHVAPIRKDSSVLSNTLVYNTVTKEIVDSGENIDKSLEDVTAVGNTTSYTVEFQNANTSLVTVGSVGIANTNPVHTLDVGTKFFIDENGSNVMDVTGNVFVSDTLFIVGNLEVLGDTTLVTQQNLLIDDSVVELGKNNYESNQGFDLGFIMTRSSAVSNVGIGYREGQDEFFLGYTDNNAYEHYITPNSDNNVKFHVYGSIVTDSNVGVGNTSPVHTLDVGSNLYVDDTASNILVVHGDAKIDEQLFVNDLTVSNVLDISGNLNALAELNITGNVYAASNVDVSKELNVAGDVHASSNIIVTRELIVSGNTNANADLNVLGDTRAFANLYVYNDETIYGNLYATSNVDVSKELNISGNVYASSDVNINEDLNVSGNTNALSHLNVTGNVYAFSNVNVTQNLNVTGNIFGSSNIVVSRDLHVSRDTYTSNLIANKKITAFGDIEAFSNVDIDKNLVVSGNVSAQSNVSVWDDLDVGGNVYALKNVNVTRDVNVSGNVHALKNVNVTKDITVTGNVYATSNIVVSKDAVIKGELYTNGNAFISKELTVTRDITALSNLGVTKDLTVTGNVFANSNVSIANELDVSGNAYISKKLYVTQDVVASSNVDVTRDVNVTRDVRVTRDVVVTGNVTATYYHGIGNALTDITLEQVTSYGNTTSNTVFFNNPNIAVVTDGDMGVGTDTPDHKLHVAGDIRADTDIYAVRYHGDGGLLANVSLQVVSDKGNTTSNTIQFTNPTTALTTDLTSNVEVKLDQLANVVLTNYLNEDMLVYDGSNWVNQKQNHTFLYAKAAVALSKGDVVYATGAVGNDTFVVDKADARDPTKMPALGIVYQDLAQNGQGLIVTFGRADSVPLDSFIEGETVYVSNTVPGGLSNVIPHGEINGVPNLIQNIGIVVKPHVSQGIVSVTGVGRTNAIPNANVITQTPAYVYTDGSTNQNTLHKIVPANLLTKLQTLEQVVNTGNTVANTINLTGLTTTAGVSIGSLSENYLPMVGANNYLVDSSIRRDNGSIIIDADTEITGNLYVFGNSITIASNSLIINDRILGIANNNPSHDLDTGFIIEHPGHNIALIHHGDEDRFSIGYTQNTFTDEHVLPDVSNIFLFDVLGNVHVQNNIVVSDTVYSNFFQGDGGLLSNLATNFEEIIINGNTTSNTVEFRGATSLVTTGSVGISNTQPGHDLSVGSNLYVDDTGSNVIHVVGNIYATSFIGDGSQLDNIASNLEEIVINGNVSTGTIQLTNPNIGLVATGNVQAARFIGDGSYLTGLVTTLEDVANNGNTTSNTIQFTNVDVGIVATGNVQAARFIGDGSYLTGLVTTLQDVANNGNTTSNTIQFTNADVGIVATGNVQAARFIGDGSYLTGLVTTLEDVANNGNTTSNTIQFTNADIGIVATGNVQAASFIGDGSQLTNIASNFEEIIINGNTSSNTVEFRNATSIVTTGSVGIANLNPQYDLQVGSNLWVDDTGSNVLTINGNVLAHKMTLDSIQIASVYALEYVTMTGNTTSNTVEFINSTTGLVTTANVGIANANPIHTLDVGSNLYVDDASSNVLYVNGNVHVAGSQLTTDGKVGVANTSPQHDLSVASNLYVDDDGSNVLVVTGNASFGSTITLGAIEITTAYNLEEVTGQGNTTSNVIQFTNSNVGLVATGGIITNKDSYACKRYAYSNVSVPFGFSNVEMTFASNVFYAKVTAQLLHGNEEVSTLTFDAQGGTRNGAESSLDVAIGSKSLFGNTNTKPWSSVVATTPTKVILEPSAAGTQTYGIDLFVEYMSSAPDGKLNSINIGEDTVKSFIY
jgi:cytoskeletal protein CcmA (bactofilin family)